MSNPYYQTGERRAGRVQDLFGAIAGRYDLLNDLQSFGLHRWWKRRLIRLARIRPGDEALDVCCGTGDVTLALARRGAKAMGLDFSEPMLAVARRRPVTGGRATFLQGDALKLPFPDGRFAVVTISYGLRNLADMPGGLREMWRVLGPGGRLLILDFGKPTHPLWRRAYFLYLETFVPLLGRFVSGDAVAYGYILESLRHYPAQSGVREMLGELAGARVEEWNLLGGVMSIHRATKPCAATIQHPVAADV
ncbi:MAG: class I SAM-dependent methyltransferase [Verrucomicrobiales bacterium]|nr:class I SAM-dependent methyltransferase [Verrucomicrobiales bacterium]MCP5527669.1 class I SAM-dependent methyltransferase [Verrucomicrobiales bacterium]